MYKLFKRLILIIYFLLTSTILLYFLSIYKDKE